VLTFRLISLETALFNPIVFILLLPLILAYQLDTLNKELSILPDVQRCTTGCLHSQRVMLMLPLLFLLATSRATTVLLACLEN
jgi:hypothetical protein